MMRGNDRKSFFQNIKGLAFSSLICETEVFKLVKTGKWIAKHRLLILLLSILLLIPAGIAVLFVVPNGIYHNIFTFLVLKIMNLGQRRKYIYGGIRQYASEEERQD